MRRDGQAHEDGGLLVPADRVGEAAEARPARQVHADRGDGEERDRRRTAWLCSPPSGIARSETLRKSSLFKPIDSVLTSSAHAAREEHPGERHEERRELEDVDHEPLERAEQRPDRQHERDRERRMPAALLHQRGQDDAGQPDDRADRQVDPAGEDDERHADGGDAEVGVVAEEVEEDLQREEAEVVIAKLATA